MPELPEVETTVRGLDQVLAGQKILDVWTDYNSPFHAGKDNIKNPHYFARFKKEIVGKKVTHVTRRAKNILIHLHDDITILIHMKMTGHFLHGAYRIDKKKWVADVTPDKNSGSPHPLHDPFNQFIRLVFTLEDSSHLAFSDMRKFAKVTLIKKTDLHQHKDLAVLGPEPLEKTFSLKKFTERLHTKPKGKIKQVLMDQSVLAGIGNIYSDEILWVAGVHPTSITGHIPPQNMAKMYDAMKKILLFSIEVGGDSMSDFRNLKGEKGGFQGHHKAYRQTGKKCSRAGCSGTITRIKLGGRSAHFCNTHQIRY